MSELKIAVSRSCPDCFSTHRTCVNIDESNYIDVAAIILSVNDVERGKLDEIDATGYGIPVFIATENEERVPAEYLPLISGVFEHCESRKEFYGRQLETAASHYETQLRRPSSAHWSIMLIRAIVLLTALVIRGVSFSVAIRQAISSWNTLVRRCSVLTCATPT
ncbi:ornithine decarboxylase [Escherichia coli]|uniref:Ornithine decarboxylase n=1 Tax=Escherichia coli TaxID=562 RepID=A0A376MTL9_ECOLX|nr:ornithine decarboxylase [Escherichia coli]